MYIIGNAETCGQIEMWSKVISMLEDGNNIDRKLQIACPRHLETPIFISNPEDFQTMSPEGGCNERCQWRLDCGHPCVNKCHSEMLHQNTMCLENCNRPYKHCSHPCLRFCGQPCGNCSVEVPGVPLPCGHVPSSLLCHQLQDLGKVKCTKLIPRKLELCGHEIALPCPKDPKTYKCNRVCGGLLPCGHQCTSVCASCTRASVSPNSQDITPVTIHASPCRTKCGRGYSTCPHNCTKGCHGEEKCPPCSQPCAIRCDHSVCGKKCSDPCAPCPERCTWGCKHRQRCEMPCAVPCNIIPCSERCDKWLDCGHQCPSVCGETCPRTNFCQVCAGEQVLNRQVDLITLETYREIDIDTEPIIVPTCGHFYTISTYDSHMGIQNAYHFDNQGRMATPRALDGSEARRSSPSEEPEKLVVKACPECRGPLRDIHRYNRIVKIAYLDESTRRFCVTAQANYVKMYKEVSDAQVLLESNREDFLGSVKQSATSRASPPQLFPSLIQKRMTKANKMLQSISALVKNVSEQEQPYARVRDMMLSRQRRDTSNDSSPFVIDNSAVQMGFRLKAHDLFLEFWWNSLWDFHIISNSSSTDSVLQMKLRRWILARIPKAHSTCSQLIQDCTEANLAKYEVQARIWRAQLFALHQLETQILQSQARQTGNPTAQQQGPQQGESNFGEEAYKEELKSLDWCDILCRRLVGTIGPLKPKIDAARQFLEERTFYAAVTPEEKEAVYLAMQAEFSSTGRWYTCPNGHPVSLPSLFNLDNTK